MNRLAALVLGLAVIVAACGDTTSTEPPPAGQTVTTAATSTTAAAPATTTSAPTTTTSPTTTTTTPPATTTTAPATTTTTTTTTVPPAPVTIEVYLFDRERESQLGHALVPVAREVPATAAVGTAALRAMIAGPTSAQAGRYYSAVPEGTRLLGLTIDDGVALVDLSSEFDGGAGLDAAIEMAAQLVFTITQFPSVDGVLLAIDGTRMDLFSAEGLEWFKPHTRADYRLVEPLPTRASGSSMAVVLVAADDALNVRYRPGIGSQIIDILLHDDRGIHRTTAAAVTVGRTPWFEVIDDNDTWGWASSYYLTAEVPDAEFAADAGARALLDDLAGLIESKGDLSQVSSQRGMYVQMFDACADGTAVRPNLYRFTPTELRTVMTDPTTRKWGTLGASCDEVGEATFAGAVGGFRDVLGDDDVEFAIDAPLQGGHGYWPPEAAIPSEFTNFHYIAVHDPGDPDLQGLDWTTWYVFFDYDSGEPRIVGLRAIASGA